MLDSKIFLAQTFITLWQQNDRLVVARSRQSFFFSLSPLLLFRSRFGNQIGECNVLQCIVQQFILHFSLFFSPLLDSVWMRKKAKRNQRRCEHLVIFLHFCCPHNSPMLLFPIFVSFFFIYFSHFSFNIEPCAVRH